MAIKRRKQAAAVADIGAVEEFASTIRMAFVQCRSDSHNMGPHDVTMDDDGNYVRTMRCRRCQTKRHQVIDGEGHIVGRAKLEYPEGYLMPKGTGRLDSEGRSVFRQATLIHEYERKANR